MEIILNNQKKSCKEPCTVQQLLDDMLQQRQKGIAVAINKTVIPKNEWDSTYLKPQDEVLIIKATQGG
jgi:sulfur carrier protein